MKKQDSFQYGRILNNCFLQVVKDIMNILQKEGLVGEHYFTIQFQTQSKNVILSQTLKNTYPDEMTIVIQNQYWDLDVQEDGFFITLAFLGEKAPIYISWTAITLFSDPSVPFTVQLNPKWTTHTSKKTLSKEKKQKKANKGKIIKLHLSQES